MPGINRILYENLKAAVWQEHCHTAAWTTQQLTRKKSEVDWNIVSSNESMIWTTELLELFSDRINWSKLSAIHPKNDGLENHLFSWNNLKQFQHRWDWAVLSANESLPWSFELIDQFLCRWDWEQMLEMFIQIESPFLLEMVDRYGAQLSTLPEGKWDTIWFVLSENDTIQWTTELLEKYKYKIDWQVLSDRTHRPISLHSNHKLLYNPATLEQFKDY